MQGFTQGQRWVSNAEPELGLGIVSAVERRRIALDFRQSGERRLYAADNAPLTRIVFKPGERVRDRRGRSFEVLRSEAREGLLVYSVRDAAGGRSALPEPELADAIDLDQPLQRLLAGQIDSPAWFRLRHRTLQALNFIERSPLLGLVSARTDLIPHQLYIAAEVAGRHAPRVLLADEVGLGKTIEAGLILQQQLFSGKAARVLILVPEALLHQWLVEMLRRFNLAFSLFDEERCASLDAEGQDNPFLAEQLVLCDAGFFLAHPSRHAQALEAGWDLLIVDEAHHLQAPREEHDDAGPVRAWRQVQAFSATVAGLILLTATPDQAGPESHFALLRLLDPHRFHDLAAFRLEQNTFSQVADLIERLEDLEPERAARELGELAPSLAALLQDREIDALLEQWRGTPATAPDWPVLRERLIRAVLDRHGTGRVLFRNTRKTVKGFPERLPHPCALPCPAAYDGDRHLLHPESTHPGDWLDIDPRVGFVLELLARLRDEKVLLICARKSTALALEEHLRLRKGIRSSVFHEDMSIIERDRAAAFFAQREQGARILLCSEIGSEGRNFQFSHHLVLFDLPRHPDLLEQRIGRLDRIGQRDSVDIHIPYLEGTAQEILFRWYHEGLDAFARTNAVAFKLHEELGPLVDELFGNAEDPPLEDLLALTRRRNRDYREEFARGRDRLLEMNSFDPTRSARLLEELHELEAESPRDYLLEVLDSFGIDAEEHGHGTWALQPGEHMLVEHFAGIPDDGLTVTFDRQVALHRDDIAFVTWFHPLVNESIDSILEGHHGKTAVGLVHDPRLAPGTLLLEALYRVTASAPSELQLQRFLPCTTLRVLIDSEGRDLGDAFPLATLGAMLQPVDRAQLAPHVNEHRDTLTVLAARTRELAQARLPTLVRQSTATMLDVLTEEFRRLTALARVNPNVRQEEIDFLQQQVRGLHAALAASTLRLEGLQLVFAA